MIAVWHPQNGCWKFFQMFAMLFSFMAAVLQFNRVSGLLVALARRWIALPVLGYFDDFKYIVLAGGGGGCSNVRQTAVPVDQAIFGVLVSWLGYVLDGTGRLCQRPRLDASLPRRRQDSEDQRLHF